MKKILVWDLSIRILHWAFALSLLGAMGIGLWVDDDSPLFTLHMILGINAVFLVLVRLLLALVGSRHNRIKAFFFSPKATLGYFVGVVTGKPNQHFVHNPGTSAAASFMYLIVPLLLVTGLLAASDWAEDTHEFLAFTLMGFVGLHLLGLIIHTLRHRDGLASSMFTGRRLGPDKLQLASPRRFWGLITLAVILAGGGVLATGYDSNAGTLSLPLLASPLQLSEDAQDKAKSSDDHKSRDDDSKRRDDDDD